MPVALCVVADEPDPPASGPDDPPELDDTYGSGPDSPGETSDGATERRPRWRLVTAVALAIVAVWLLVAGLLLVSGASSAARGIDAMGRVRRISTGNLTAFVDSLGDSGSVKAKRVDRNLAEATDSFQSAHSAMTTPIVAPLRVLPVVGRQIRAVAAMSDAAATTTSSARDSFSEMSDIASSEPSTPKERLEAGRATKAVLEEFSAQVEDLDLGPEDGLIGPLTKARRRFTDENRRLLDTLTRAHSAVTGVDAFLSGPTRYLVLAANNAEMGAGSGMYLQAGELTIDEGQFSLSPMEPTAEMVLDSPGSTLDRDVAALWDWMEPNVDWRNLNVTPRFDESARMASEMWTASGHTPVDGVIAIDVVGLKRLLELTGPVEVSDADGTKSTVSADDVVKDLLLQQYISFETQRDERRDRLSTVGQAVFSALNQREYSPGQLMHVLQSSGNGRHLMMWSSDPLQQSGWESLGAAGSLSHDDMMLSVMNRGGNKLDQFLRVKSKMTWSAADDRKHVTVKVQITNKTPETGLPRYVAGPYPGLDVQAGQYVGLLQLTVPKAATSPTTQGAELYLSGDDGPNRALVTKVDVSRGQDQTITFEFDLPSDQRAVRVLSSARVPRTEWTAGPAGSAVTESWIDSIPHTVRLTSGAGG